MHSSVEFKRHLNSTSKEEVIFKGGGGNFAYNDIFFAGIFFFRANECPHLAVYTSGQYPWTITQTDACL